MLLLAAINKAEFVAQKAKHVRAIMQYTITRPGSNASYMSTNIYIRAYTTYEHTLRVLCLCIFIAIESVRRRICNVQMECVRGCYTWSFRYSSTKYCLKHDCIQQQLQIYTIAATIYINMHFESIQFFCQQTRIDICSWVCFELFVVRAYVGMSIVLPQSILMAFTLSKFENFTVYRWIM